jgi:hypothetical protein
LFLGTIRTLIRFGGKEMPMPKAAPHPDPDISKTKYSETTIGDLRRLYGPGFAKGCKDNERIADVVRKQPSLMRVIRPTS